MLQSEQTVNFSVFQPKLPDNSKIELADSAASPDRITLVFRTDDVHVFLSDGEQAILGRAHHTNKIAPTVDLASFGGVNCGTSRMHASLRREDNQWWIEDLGSSNGTWVNGERLAPFCPFLLKENSQVLLANLEVGIIIPNSSAVSRAA